MSNEKCKKYSKMHCAWRQCRTCTQCMEECILKDYFCADKGTMRCKKCAMNTGSYEYKVSTSITCSFPELNTNDFQSKFPLGETGVTSEGKPWVMSPIK